MKQIFLPAAQIVLINILFIITLDLYPFHGANSPQIAQIQYYAERSLFWVYMVALLIVLSKERPDNRNRGYLLAIAGCLVSYITSFQAISLAAALHSLSSNGRNDLPERVQNWSAEPALAYLSPVLVIFACTIIFFVRKQYLAQKYFVFILSIIAATYTIAFVYITIVAAFWKQPASS